MYVCEKCGKQWKDTDAEGNEYVCIRRCGGALAVQKIKPVASGELLDWRSREEANRWLLVDGARDNARSTLDSLTMNKYFPQCYLEREGDRQLWAVLHHSHKAIVLSGEAGSGKSSLLCRLVEELLQRVAVEEEGAALPTDKVKSRETAEQSGRDAYLALKGRGDVVIFLSGRSGMPAKNGESVERAFCQALLRACGVKEGEFQTPLEFLKRLDENVIAAEGSERRVWIILDSLNEVDHFRELALYLDQFIHASCGYPWLRVVCSCRSGALDILSGKGRRQNNPGFLPFSDEKVFQVFRNLYTGRPRWEPRLQLPAFTALETERAYLRRQERLPQRAARNRYADLSPNLKELLANPLYLHIFHETWQGQNADLGDISGEQALFGAYLHSLTRALPGINQILVTIASYFYEQETPVWPEEEAWKAQEAWIRDNQFDSVLQVGNLTPVETLVAASLLMRPTAEAKVFQFSHQKICEQVLQRKLAAIWDDTPKNKEAVRELFGLWLEKGERCSWLANAMTALLVPWLRVEKAAYLPLLLETGKKVDQALEKVCRAIFLEMGEMVDLTEEAQAFLQNGFQADNRYQPFYGALYGVCYTLRKMRKFRESLRIIESCLPWHQMLSALGTNFHHDLSKSFVLAGDLNQSLGSFERALEYYQQSLKIAEELTVREPESLDFRCDLSENFKKVGEIYSIPGKEQQALKYYQQSLKIDEELTAREPERTDFYRDLSVSMRNVGDIYYVMGERQQALEYYQQSLKIVKELVVREPDRLDFRCHLSGIFDSLGGMYLNLGELGQAQEYYQQSLKINEELVAREPERTAFRRELSWIFYFLGKISRAQGEAQKALKYYQQSLKNMQGMFASELNNRTFRRDLRWIFEEVTELYRSLGEIQQVRDYDFQFNDFWLELAEKSVAQEPDRLDLRLNLADCLEEKGAIYMTQGKPQEALEYYQQSRKIREEWMVR